MKKNSLTSLNLVLILIASSLISCKKDPVTPTTTTPTTPTNSGNSSTSVTDVDGNKYAAVKIGNQNWMKFNLKVSKLNDGTNIPEIKPNDQWGQATTAGFSYYDNNNSNDSIYGKLYNWYAVNTGKVCPTGWRVPTLEDWEKLSVFLGGDSISGGKLKYLNNNNWSNPTTQATNSSGFTALPGGMRWYNGSFGSKTGMGNWWAQNEMTSNTAAHIILINYSDMFSKSENFKKAGMSIRCIENN
jgi:uncharacterized protein (TIGR02145 family)